MLGITVFTGYKDGFHWVSVQSGFGLMEGLVQAVPEIVVGHVVAITASDSGPLKPNEDELRMGWFQEGEVLWTTRMLDPHTLPLDQYDEWFVFDQHKPLPPLERLVNYGGFRLEPPVVQLPENPTCERHLDESLIRLQDLFWEQMARVNPISYLADGDCLNFATRDEAVFKKAVEWSKHPFPAV